MKASLRILVLGPKPLDGAQALGGDPFGCKDVTWGHAADAEDLQAAIAESGWDVLIADCRSAAFDPAPLLAPWHERLHTVATLLLCESNSAPGLAMLASNIAGACVCIDFLPHVLGGLRELAAQDPDGPAAPDASARLRTSEERYRSLVEQLPAITYMVDMASGIRPVYISPQIETILGYRQEEWLSDPGMSRRLLHPDDRDRVIEEIYAKLKTGEPFSLFYRKIARDGHVVWFHNMSSWIRDEQGKARFVQGVLLDVTQQKEAEERLKRTEEHLRQTQKMDAIGRLAGGVAHDFNNLLTAILGYGHMLRKDLPDGDPHRKDVEEILKAGHRAADLVKQLLLFGRKQMSRVQRVDLNDIVRETAGLLRRTIGEHIELTTTLHAQPVTIEGDPSQLSQVIMNLAVNARDAMTNGGLLTVQTSRTSLWAGQPSHVSPVNSGAYAVLTMRDTGCGMDQETMERAFEPFFTTKKTGTGLGLSTVYGIVRQSSGHITLASEKGKGTEFTIYWPLVDAPPDPSPAEALQAPRGRETVLVVEDEETVRKMVARMLKSLGYEVLSAQSGAEALETAARHCRPIHAVLTDVVMPFMSGPECVEQLYRLRQDFKVLFMTGFSEDAITLRGWRDRNAPVLHKPFSLEDLAQRLRDVLRSPTDKARDLLPGPRDKARPRDARS